MLWLVPPLARALLMLLGCTLRFEYSWEDEAEADASRRFPREAGVIAPFWHECLLLAAYGYRDSKATVIISSSFDGECIARTIHPLGLRTVRGSSTRGGSEALRAMPVVAQGGLMVFTADGPKGPARVPKLGPIALARSTGCPICCFHLAPGHAWRLPSWDGLLIPRPFTRVHARLAKLIRVPAGAGRETMRCLQEEVRATLERTRLEAERRVRAAIED